MYACIIIINRVPGDIDIGDNDSDTASQEATPTSSASPPKHATSFLPGSERMQVEKGNQTNMFQYFTQSFYS